MATFSLLDQDGDYQGFFITQQSKENIVSLEDNGEFKMVHDPNCSDISDGDEDFEKQLRFVLLVCDSILISTVLQLNFLIFF